MKTLKRSALYIPVGSTMEFGNRTYILVCVSKSPLYGLEFHFEDAMASDRKKMFYEDELQHLVSVGIKFNIFCDEYGNLQDVAKELSSIDNATNIIPLVNKARDILNGLG